VKLNATEVLKELVELQESGLLGTILIVDNQRLIEDTLQEKQKLSWHEGGNISVARLLTEITMTSSLTSNVSVNKGELMGILCERGFLTISKVNTNKSLQGEIKITEKVHELCAILLNS